MPRKSDDPFYAQELPGLDGLNAVSATVKNDEEVCRYIETEALTADQRFVYILEKGSDVQRGAVLERIKQTFEDSDAAGKSRVIEALNTFVWRFEQSVQLTGAAALSSSLATLGESHVTELLELLQTMVQLKEEKVRETWADLMVETMRYLPQAVIESQMLEYALKLGELSEPQHSRMLCCRLLGPLATRAPSPDFITGFLEKAMSLCQDTDFSVRAAMCAQLDSLARAIGLATTKKVLTKELFELLADEERDVARAAYSALLDLTDFFDAAFRREQVYPLLRGYAQNPPEAVRQLVIAEFGKLCWQTRHDISWAGEADAMLFLEFFKGAASSTDPESRRLCAYNFPGVAAALPVSLFAQHLGPIYKALSEDSFQPSRESIAASMFEMAEILGDRAFHLLKGPFVTLIQNKEAAVQEHLIRNLSALLNRFAAQMTGPEVKERYFSQVLQPLVEWWETAAKSSSRKQEMFLGHWSHLPQYFTPTQLHQTFIPLLLKVLQSGPRTLADSAAEHLVHFTRCLSSHQLETELFTRFVVEFGKSRTYSHRLSFLRIVAHTPSHYSRHFFRERMLDPCLELSRDPVSCVRRRVAMMLPLLKKALRPPCDVDQHAAFLQVVSKLQLDPNKEVLEVVAVAAAEVEALEQELQRHEQGKGAADIEADRVDAAREAHESQLLELAKEQDKQERRQKIREMLKNDREEEQRRQQESGRKPSGKRGTATATGDYSPPATRQTSGVPALPGIGTKSPAGGGAAAVRGGGASGRFHRHGSGEGTHGHLPTAGVGSACDSGPGARRAPLKDDKQKRGSYGPPGSLSGSRPKR